MAHATVLKSGKVCAFDGFRAGRVRGPVGNLG